MDVVQWLIVVAVVGWDIVGAWSIGKWGVVDIFHVAGKINIFRGLVISRVVFRTGCVVSVYAGVNSMCAVFRFQNLSSHGIFEKFRCFFFFDCGGGL